MREEFSSGKRIQEKREEKKRKKEKKREKKERKKGRKKGKYIYFFFKFCCYLKIKDILLKTTYQTINTANVGQSRSLLTGLLQ